MVTAEEIRRLEQVWMVLADLFEDLTRRAVYVDAASKLRNCKSLLNFVRTEVARSSLKEPFVAEDSLLSLRLILAEIRQDLLMAAHKLDHIYAQNWAGKLDKAERVELDQQIIYEQSKFVAGVWRSPNGCWMRLTLPKPVKKERLSQVAAQYDIVVELQNSHHVVLRGETARVKRIAQDVYASLTPPAGSDTIQMPYVVKVDKEKCTGCGACVTICPVAVLELESNFSKVVRQEECIGCMVCVEGCPEAAITVAQA